MTIKGNVKVFNCVSREELRWQLVGLWRETVITRIEYDKYWSGGRWVYFASAEYFPDVEGYKEVKDSEELPEQLELERMLLEIE